MPFALNVSYLEGRTRSVTAEEKKEINSNEETAARMARKGQAGTLITTGMGVTANGQEFITNVVSVASGFSAFVDMAANAAKLGFWKDRSSVGRLVADPSCNYVFDTVRAVTCRDSGDFARKQLDKWLYYKNEKGNAVETTAGELRLGFEKNFIGGIQERAGGSMDIEDHQITGSE